MIVPTAPPKVRLTLYAAGYCVHPEWVTLRGGGWRAVRIPAIFACIEHPRAGTILWDTGYSPRFIAETARWPGRLYRMVTPVVCRPEDSASHQLGAAGIRPEQVSYVIVSHFHADHVAGLGDFPAARFIYASDAYEAVRSLSGLAAVRRAFLPGLLPGDFEERSRPLRPDMKRPLPGTRELPFDAAYDILGDGSLLAVSLPGHAEGQLGLLLSTDRHDYLLCADAAWSSAAYRLNRPPHWIAGAVMPDRAQYADSFASLVGLHRRHPQLRIVPSHCPEVWRQWIEGGESL